MQASTSTDVGDIPEITNMEEFSNAKKNTQDKGLVVLISANWYEPCKVIKDTVFPEMAKVFKHLAFTWVDSDKFTDLVDKHEIDTVPTVLVFHNHKTDVDKYVNPSPEALNVEIEKLNDYYKTALEGEKERVFKEIDIILSSAPMVCFIKGSPTEPKCKFTRRLLAHTNKFEITFKHFNILEDQRIRQWLKVYSGWKTFPQVFVNKEFIGGIDVIDGLVEEDEFLDSIPKECKKLPPIEVFDQMLTSFDVVILIEGTAEAPTSESSKSLIETLSSNSVKYVSVDYSSLDQEVKDHITSVHGVSTSPYIFLKQKPFGDLEAFKKVVEDNTLETVIPEGSRKLSLNDKLKKLINSSPIIMFIKGNPKEPQCGFSSTLVKIMGEYDYQYGYFNILDDDEVRQGLKKYSNWQTYPQLYVKGKFIGGIDIIKELHEEHELEDELMLSLN
mmetsp:Transcript_18228/g.20401  ORF Transcript_18228/g.20401 Transcript_18228/m.20401 type:complete len:444 (+) Transcript_18228:1-1332(+)|eukprot:CAMPEP_0205825334 /NCGR_PEP_ID=MMETSP0206-20130828/24808_1 /ASSEMBLY_ACC=CAM_ASM_000279 /TAXON_ID=36767 /ORGANISM="Euplotes focardii, Strain TN1" /LENGTH=443 /DNA_ID=CAMNT_0053124289 /DNA_START=1 /DNA_END=1332 /DNA_ORIENTATION=+